MRLRLKHGIDAKEKKRKSKPKGQKEKVVFTKVGGGQNSDGEETVAIEEEDDALSEAEEVQDDGDHASDDEELEN